MPRSTTENLPGVQYWGSVSHVKRRGAITLEGRVGEGRTLQRRGPLCLRARGMPAQAVSDSRLLSYILLSPPELVLVLGEEAVRHSQHMGSSRGALSSTHRGN